MRTAIIAFTNHGADMAKTLTDGLAGHGYACRAWVKMKNPDQSLPEQVERMNGSLGEWTGERFQDSDVLIFIGAVGIAVRSIAPYIKSKKTDPAVIVLDEQGRHAISLLSGHIGGANACTLLVAELTGAEPVITTATDLNGKFAVDAFAARRNLYLDSMPIAKEIAAELVAGRKVGMRSSIPVMGKIPEELDTKGTPEVGFSIGIRKEYPFTRTLHLIPKMVVLGIGCRKGAGQAQIEALVSETLEEYGIYKESVERIVSIDLKKEEAGIQGFSKALGVPFETYTADELKLAESENGFTESDFVRSVTGVSNVCERAALLGAGTTKLLIPKTAQNGVTVAAAVREYTICMEE
jgi:cobalt-precorrin 5A hydrolase